MRSLLIAAMLVSTVFLGLAHAQTQGSDFATDPKGDTAIRTFGGPAVPASPPGADAADLVAMEVQEDAEQLIFTLKAANLDQKVSSTEYKIAFTWLKTPFSIYLDRETQQGVGPDTSSAYLINGDDGNRFNSFAELDHKIDVGAGTLTIYLPKVYILSEKGRFPLLGDALTDVYAEAREHTTFFQFDTDAYDRMPDGDAVLKYPFQFGDVASGHLRMDADERVRVSNGGATTFVYQTTVKNTAETDDQVDLVVSDLPENWNATVQSPLKIPAGAERHVAVLVSVPFAHVHGGFSSFNFTAKSQNDIKSFASIRMGVLHTPIPQPAGHHSEIYLHAHNLNGFFGTVFPYNGAQMNTEQKHDGDAPEASPWGNTNDGGVQWQIPLAPELRMGLDFDLTQTGTLVGSIIGHQPQPSAGKIEAQLFLVKPTDASQQGGGSGSKPDGLLLADSTSQDVTLDLNTPQAFKLTLTPTPESDYVPYVKGQNLLLILTFKSGGQGPGTICCIPGATPGLTTADFKMQLPLNEYNDRLSGLAEVGGDILELKANGPVEKTGLPGTTMTYAFDLVNHGGSDETVDLDVAGTDAKAGTLVPDQTVTIPAKESKKLTLAVAIPTGKNDGEELEVLIFAHAREDPSKSAIARTKTIVAKSGSTATTADESAVLLAAQKNNSKKTPGPSALLAFAAVGAALVVARGRRRG